MEIKEAVHFGERLVASRARFQAPIWMAFPGSVQIHPAGALYCVFYLNVKLFSVIWPV